VVADICDLLDHHHGVRTCGQRIARVHRDRRYPGREQNRALGSAPNVADAFTATPSTAEP